MLRELALRTATTPAELELFCGLSPATKPPPQQSNYPQQNTGSRASNWQTNAAGLDPRRGQFAAWQSNKGAKRRTVGQVAMPTQAPTDLAEQILRVLIQFPHLGKGLDSSRRQLILKSAQQRSAKTLGLMEDLLKQCDLVEFLSQGDQAPAAGAGAFALFQEQLAQSELAPLYEILRQRVMGSDLNFDGAKADLNGAMKKLELLHLKEEMTEIAQKIAQNVASETDRSRYRELGEKLKIA